MFFMNFGEITTMPLILRKEISGACVAVWHITEAAGELLRLLPNHLEEDALRTPIKNELLFRQRLASRLLVSELLGHQPVVLGKEGPKRTVLRSPSWPLSISHAGDYAAVMIGQSVTCVGVDIEVIHPRIKKIAGRFMHESEWAYAEHREDFRTLMLIWSVKEAVFKMAGVEGLDFKTQIRCMPLTLTHDGKVMVRLLLPNETRHMDAHYRFHDGTVLVYVTS